MAKEKKQLSHTQDNHSVTEGKTPFTIAIFKRTMVSRYPIRNSKILEVFQQEILRSKKFQGFPGGASGKEPTCQCRGCKKCGFDPCVGKIPWRRDWQSTPVFLSGESHGQRSLAGYSPKGCKESDITEMTQHRHAHEKF